LPPGMSTARLRQGPAWWRRGLWSLVSSSCLSLVATPVITCGVRGCSGGDQGYGGGDRAGWRWGL
jgi:hypothetical protein